MGLFSTIYSNYLDCGPDFAGEFQTKDLESLMDSYWLSPNGELFYIDLTNAYTLSNSFDENLDVFNFFKWEKTGENGYLRPSCFTGCLRMYNLLAGKFNEAVFYLDTGKIVVTLEVNGSSHYDRKRSNQGTVFAPGLG